MSLALLFNQPASVSGFSLSGIPTAETFGVPALSVGSVSFTLTGIPTAEAFGSPTSSATISLSLTGIATAETFGAPTLLEADTLTLIGIPTAEAFGVPTFTEADTIALVGIPTAEAFGVPAALSRSFALIGIATAETFGAPTIGLILSLTLSGIPTAEAFGVPTFTEADTIALIGIPTAEAFGVLAFGGATFAVSGIASAETFGSPTLSAKLSLLFIGIPSAETFGVSAFTEADTLSLIGIPTAEAFGVAISLPNSSFAPTGIGSSETFGTPTSSATAALSLFGVPSSEAFGLIRSAWLAEIRVTTYPDGQVLLSSALTPLALNLILQTLTCQALGIDPTIDPLAYSKVRLDWPTEGQPAFEITDDVCFLRVTEEDDQYNRIRDRKFGVTLAGVYSQTDTFVRVWRVSWSFYGPTAFDNARLLKSALFSADFVHDALANSNLYMTTDVAASVRSPEKFQSQWWDKTELFVRMNELVIETLSLSTITSAEVIAYNAAGEIADVEVT